MSPGSVQPIPLGLRLYVTGRTPGALEAIATLHRLQAEVNCRIEIVDVLEDPSAALRDGIFATPTLVRVRPAPLRRVFGCLSSVEHLRESLELDTANPNSAGLARLAGG